MEFRLLDILRHFLQCLQFCHLKTLLQVWQDILLHANCDYILSSDHWLFKTVGIWYMQNFSSDQFNLLTCLLKSPTRCHRRYLWGRHAFPLTLPAPENFSPADDKFQELKYLDPPPPLFTPSVPTVDIRGVAPVDCRARLSPFKHPT